jgi:hypothetical protein
MISVTNTAATALAIANITMSGTFTQTNTCGSVGPGANCSISVSFAPTVAGAQAGSVILAHNVPGGIKQITLSGTATPGGGPVVSLPANFSLGGVTIPLTSVPQNLGLSNFGNAPLIFTAIPSISGPNAPDFKITANSCLPSVPVAANGGNCTVTMTFTPTVNGSENATLTFTDNAVPSPQTVALSGLGSVPIVTFTPPSVSFGNQTQGIPSARMTFDINVDPSGGDLLIGSLKISGPNAADFSQTNNCGAKVPADSSCTVTVIFTPSTAGTENAAITLTDNAVPSTQMIPLSGVGVSGTTSFTFMPAPGTTTQVTITGGSTAQFTIMLNPSASSVGPVSFACTGNPPTTLCAVTPSSGTLTGSTPITLVVTLRTNCITSLAPPIEFRPGLPPMMPPQVVVLWLLSLLGLAVVRKFAPQTRLARVAPAVAMLLLTVIMPLFGTGCGSGASVIAVPGQPTTPPGLYTITITGTSGAVTQNIQLLVRVV